MDEENKMSNNVRESLGGLVILVWLALQLLTTFLGAVLTLVKLVGLIPSVSYPMVWFPFMVMAFIFLATMILIAFGMLLMAIPIKLGKIKRERRNVRRALYSEDE